MGGNTAIRDEDCHDEAINTDDTGHDDWNDVFDDQVWTENTHGGNANT